MSKESRIYAAVNWILRDLRTAYKNGEITKQEYRTIKGQAVSGDIEGAEKGLKKLLGV